MFLELVPTTFMLFPITFTVAREMKFHNEYYGDKSRINASKSNIQNTVVKQRMLLAISLAPQSLDLILKDEC